VQTQNFTARRKSVPFIEVLPMPPTGARRFAGPFYPDESAKLKELLTSLRDRKSYLVATDPDGLVNVYRRARP
jgi:hypothetical protein